jgi:hypothetical protein
VPNDNRAWLVVTKALTPVIYYLTDKAAKIVEWQGFVPLIIEVAAAFGTFKTVKTVMTYGIMLTIVKTAQLLLNASMLANPIVWIVAVIKIAWAKFCKRVLFSLPS